ncbi:MAG: ParB/RepB/Spo0J family partition protein [candidate division KSB1 bacterium]|jgi:ParB family chromosome partitioning protein|nr:ParB/RepB/Spo0J family partition protein [candidate division KSB1 bacterium]
MTPNRLGKGLRALIPDIPPEENEERKASVREVEVSRVSPNPFQPREEFDKESLEDLKRSIAEKGVIQPITVRHFESGFQLIAGERRLRAVTALGLATIPAYVLDVKTDEDMLELSLIENIQREDLNPIDIARGYNRLLNECKLTQDNVARRVGKDRSTVTNFLRLLKLPQQIQESLKRKEIDMGHARALISIDDKSMQLKIWKDLIKNKLSVRKVESVVRQTKKGSPPKPGKAPEKDFYLVETENKLQEILGTRVNITSGKKGGKIDIEYYSDEDLERILDLISSLS